MERLFIVNNIEWAQKEIEHLRNLVKTAEETAYFNKLVECYLFLTLPKINWHSKYYTEGIEKAEKWVNKHRKHAKRQHIEKKKNILEIVGDFLQK